ncbi:PREDICTED: receptor-like protein 12 [Prunus mume]|uniref:Receptor-like protein 12 n=1 Tax=Prunus mume TaxID=102107 RepID=A0ABM1LJR1_PRUMU|nr:PREDICTED: receptor-like protein 12 [Prunus mume]
MKHLLQYFLLLFLITTVCFAIIPAVHSRCFKDQQLSLLHLKKSLQFYPDPLSYPTKVTSWNSSTDCCSWVGVTCSSDGHVVGLDLSNETISGGIGNSSSLFDLQHLQSLNLADNYFDHEIPSAIGKLVNLRYLNLSYNTYFGEIPIEISRLTRLVVLDMSGSEDSNITSPKLSMLFHNLTELAELYFDHVHLSAEGTHWSQAISNLTNLRVLSLSDTGISGPIDQFSFAQLQSFSVIRLGFNDISATVPGFFANFSELTSLSLRSCGLKGTFPNEILEVPTLQTLYLSTNDELHGTLPEFPSNASLRSLVLSDTKFSGLLPDSIGNLKKLSLLDLSSCSFYGSIPESIANLTQLVGLQLGSNCFNGSIDSIRWENLINLVDLQMDGNLLEGSIPSSLFYLPLLTRLVLSGNQFSGKLHAFANTSSNLYSLELSFNNLEGPIPTSIFNFHRLQILFLSSNNFTGFLFSGPQQLRTLTAIDLSHNGLLMFSDGSYSTFPEIEFLDLASTNLRTFPDFLRNQSKLISLDLSENQIQGKIPHWIWSLNHLDYLNLSCNSLVTLEAPLHNSTVLTLDLHSNQLQGQIPTFIPFAVYLDYSSNHFNSIPSDIGYFLTFTLSFSLSSNNLHGLIPVSICNVETDIQILDLSNNFLSGIIPPCLTAMRSLRVLNLARNNLTGTISNFQVTEDSSLEILELGGNQLGGQFPKSLGNCTRLQVLNLGNNRITDSFPCLLKNISTLRVLVLQSNNFYGGIGCPNTYGTWPMLQIIHLAHNNFTGEIPAMFLTAWQVMMTTNNGSLSIVKVHLDHGARITYVDYSFEDGITVTSKGSQMDLLKILSIFTLIDFSCNNFSGPIPKEIGEFKSLHVLNLSGNAFTGEIPPSFGNMGVLESLDLSHNKLSGQIPPQLVKLTFLEVLDLSNNQLVGRIPTGTQFSTFPKDSFTGNKGLWGPPLTVDDKAGLQPPATVNGRPPNFGHHREVNWDLISVEIGFTFGFGVAVGSLVLCKRWSKWYYRAMYNILLKIFPQLEERIGIHRGHVHINQRWWRR